MSPDTSRRRALVVGASALSYGLSGCLGVLNDSTTDRLEAETRTCDDESGHTLSGTWPTEGYDAANAGFNPDATGPADGVERAWRFETDERIYRPPVVSDGTVFVASNDGFIYALDAGSGCLRWRFRTDGIGLATPTVVDGTLYAGTRDGLYALDAASGEKEWLYRVEGDVGSSTVVDDAIYVGITHEEHHEDTVTATNYVVALDSADGTERWRRKLGHDDVVGAPAVVGETVYFSTRDGVVHAVNAGDGTEQWRYEHNDATAPAVAEETVYVGLEGALFALDATSGTERWHTSDGLGGTPAVADGTVYAGTENAYAVDAATGDVRWRAELNGERAAAPAVGDGTVYVTARRRTGEANIADDEAKLYALDAASGSIEWTFEQTASGFTSPVVVDDRVLVGSQYQDNSVYALR